VAVNKLDLVGWSQVRFNEIQELVLPFLISIGYKASNVHFVPISGLQGANLLESPADYPDLQSWYQGRTLLDELDSIQLGQRPVNKPIRVCVYEYYKSTVGNLIGDCLQVKVEAGIIRERDQILLMPFEVKCTVKTIEIKKQKVTFANPGTLCELAINLPNSFDPNFLKKGNVLCDIDYPINQVYQIRAEIQVFDIKLPIVKGQFVLIYSFST
jgi:elongation factor 1 alpha-like protein